MKTLHLQDNWEAFAAVMEDTFTDKLETGKDHEWLLALKYNGDMPIYLARFNELNSRVNLSGQSLKRVLMADVIPDMYGNIWRKYGIILDTDADLLHAVQEARTQEEELARALAVKKQFTRPQKEKEKEAVPKWKTEQKAAQAQDRAPAMSVEQLAPYKGDKFPEQEILWGLFKDAMKDTPEE